MSQKPPIKVEDLINRVETVSNLISKQLTSLDSDSRVITCALMVLASAVFESQDHESDLVVKRFVRYVEREGVKISQTVNGLSIILPRPKPKNVVLQFPGVKKT